MIQHQFKSSCEFATWASENNVYSLYYLGGNMDYPNQPGQRVANFEMDIETKNETQLACIGLNANELFFMSHDELFEWLIKKNAKDLVNNGSSDTFKGFVEFSCLVQGKTITCYVGFGT